MPNTGHNEGSREVMMVFRPIRSKPWVRPMEVTVLPSPEAVGVVAVTRISFPRGGNAASESKSSFNLGPERPMGSKKALGGLSLRAVGYMGTKEWVQGRTITL